MLFDTLYDLARKGKEVERESRFIALPLLELLSFEAPRGKLRVRCSKGTYVRTICHDIGQALGCGGCMSALRRTEAAGFTLEQAVTLEQLQAAPDPAALLAPVDGCFQEYPAVTIGEGSLKKAQNGSPFSCVAADGTWRVYGPDGEFLLLGRCEGGIMTTIKSFFEV